MLICEGSGEKRVKEAAQRNNSDHHYVSQAQSTNNKRAENTKGATGIALPKKKSKDTVEHSCQNEHPF